MNKVSDYQPPFFLPNGHLQTIYPAVFRRVRGVNYVRERIATPDGDFLELDVIKGGSDRVAIISHGMEASSRSNYVLGMARALKHAGWDIVAWNCRGCGGAPNTQLRFYHSGSSDDLDCVVSKVLSANTYKRIALIGFSIGGNITLKYLGEKGSNRTPEISGAAVFSVPCDLKSSATALSRRENIIYMKRFLYFLRRRMREKATRYPQAINIENLAKIKTFEEFDNLYTAPIHGFKNADEYWKACSSRYFLDSIRIPVLIVNALNDPFLDDASYPFDIVKKNSFIKFEAPRHGGHVGFADFQDRGLYWSERRTMRFLEEIP